MAARLDLEARLRALREPTAATPPPPAPVVDPPLPVAEQPPPTMYIPPPQPTVVHAPPPPAPLMAPPSPEAPAAPPAPMSTPTTTPPKRTSFSRPRPNFAALSTPVTPPRTVPRPASSSQLDAQPSAPQPPPVDMSKLLGPAYEAAVAEAQFAIESERKRLVHTAIDAYIGSGQKLVALGRQQTVLHLQNILRTKALALLQRAEGLEEWSNRIVAEIHAKDRAAAAASGVPVVARSKEETLRAAFAHSQEQEEQALQEKEALVAKMKTQNNEMLQKLNQLVLITKVRARFKRVISDRRARKAEEQRRRGESGEHDDDEMDVDEARSQDDAVDEYHEEDDTLRESDEPTMTASLSMPASSSTSPREEQKRTLLNELHQRIGLPQVDHLRQFQPLAATEDSDRRRDNLARELEEARVEADRLRAAVQEMEHTLRAAAEHSRKRSIKLEKEKEEEVAQLQAELARMKSALELERRSSSKRSSVYLDSDDDGDGRPKDPDAYEDHEIMSKLRVSLQGLGHEDTVSPRERRSSSGRSSRVARTSETHSSPRHRAQRVGSWGFDRDDEKDEDGASDDGLWV